MTEGLPGNRGPFFYFKILEDSGAFAQTSREFGVITYNS